MSKHARLMSWVISSHNWDSPAGTPSLSQREPRIARARALKNQCRCVESYRANRLRVWSVASVSLPSKAWRWVPPRARAPPALAPRIRLSLREQRRDVYVSVCGTTGCENAKRRVSYPG